MRNRSARWLIVVLSVVTLVATAQAQPPFGGPPGGGEGRRGPWGHSHDGDSGERPSFDRSRDGDSGERPSYGRSRGGGWGDPEERARRFEGYMSQLDQNKNGQIDEDEVSGWQREMVERVVGRAGLEAKYPLSISKLRDALRNPPATDSSTDDKKDSSDDKESSSTESAVPGFGEEVDLPPVPGFGETAEESTTSKTASTTSRSTSRPASSGDWKMRSSSSSSGSTDERIRSYASSLLKQNDKNGNGTLEKEEWQGMRSDTKEADRNDDGVITLDELTARLASFSQGRSRGRSGSSGGSGHRFRSGSDRSPSGLPDWFYEKDADGDGQVFMAEYAHDWNSMMVDSFTRWDLNHDGVVTPEECRAAEKDD